MGLRIRVVRGDRHAQRADAVEFFTRKKDGCPPPARPRHRPLPRRRLSGWAPPMLQSDPRENPTPGMARSAGSTMTGPRYGHDMEGMHTSSELSDRSFEVRIDDRVGSWRDLFPGFDEHDRLGLVVSSPHGALGASLLYLAAVHAFYELCRERSDEFWIYPDFFFFHVGTRLGHHGSLDVWPDHKEVLVEADGDRLLEAVNDRAVTRLVVPEGSLVLLAGQGETSAPYLSSAGHPLPWRTP
jgi:hypothetical protein